ncbi:thioredoxin [Ruminococcaceae bacterium R-25]|nr:thioredoxin [Ruminococcaceae bacterium R-25]SUQ21974.1 Thioredoxin [Oscillospiraceae bacterium]
MAYLGDYSYSDPAICMVYERVEDETDDDGNPLYGIQYRKVTDLDGLKASGITLLIYFYSSMDNGSAMVTASVEDIALSYNGKLTVLMLDAMEYKDLMDKYEIEAVPEFVLIRKGQADKVFGGMSREYWTVNDVLSWLQENGIS